MKIKKTQWMGLGIGIVMAIISLWLFYGNRLLYFLLIISLVISTLPFMMSFILNQDLQKKKEEKFLEFSRDLVENVKSGTPISKSILNLKNRDYSELNPHIQKLANQLALGLTLTQALKTFARDINSKTITRAVGLISEAERAGGKIESILESVAKSINQIENLKKERKAAVSNLVTQGYIIFMVFIIIMLVLEFKILPLVSDLSTGGGLNIKINKVSADEFSMPLLVMILVQSFFAGLVIGKLSEGSIKNGIKHSFILLTLTLLITTGAKAWFA
ncbi:MAG: type II secretion system F family protein [archaeon]